MLPSTFHKMLKRWSWQFKDDENTCTLLMRGDGIKLPLAWQDSRQPRESLQLDLYFTYNNWQHHISFRIIASTIAAAGFHYLDIPQEY